ncbi:RagB/SusD family nutrient uptake outer membrane protein [Sinomicrobium soli]|uniref:RagB/SusD family nutrient uptake outer membrane protein n=1 Tax=Sinomicrobium sp. N-1-3-6 TaxID=2219864 RepID=UPI001374A570|nr:RagB/SusD family nutrient uptake outer membrane protein [Sinomicrobium sp. N-1-3-6]
MKNIYKRYYKVLFGILGIMIYSSCSDEFLEVVPKGQLIGEKVVDYDKMFYNLNLINMTSTNAQVPLGAELVAFEPYISGSGLRTQRLYRWEAEVYNDGDNAAELENTMENIYIYNKIINEVMEATEGSEAEKRSLRAEALAGRAWTYFLLINYYGLPYNEGTSATDAGFPIVEVADLVASDFRRATVQEVYDFIVDDLTTALQDLPAQVPSRFRFSQAAGKALLGKVYTFMGKFEEASPLLTEALDQIEDTGTEVRLLDYNEGYSNPRVDTDPEGIYGKQFSNNWANTASELVVNPEIMALFDESDLRLEYLYTETAQNGNEYPLEGVFRKQIGTGQTFFGVRVQEVYLFLAEVKCRLGDLTAAVSILEEFRKHRMPEENAIVPQEIAADRETLLRFVFDERLREFAAQGVYWFDMRRLTVDPDIPVPVSSYTHTIYDTDGSVKGEYQLTKERLVLRFPKTVTDQNPNLENNP